MPNRRRRRLSTTMSAVAALAVASPFAVAAAVHVTANLTPAPQEREFVQAASIKELPNELYGVLQSSLSQFGIVLPNIPSSLLGPEAGLASPAVDGIGTPSFPTLGGSALADPGLASPGLTNPALTSPTLTSPGLTTPGLTSPTDPPTALTTPLIGDDSLLGSPTDPAAAPLIGGDSTLANPLGVTPGLTVPSEVPITAPVGLDAGLGLDPTMGTYPILGDPLMTSAPPSSGGLVDEIGTVANEGVTQAMDMFKNVLMPQMMQAIQNAAPPAAAAPAPLPAAPPPVG